ncbi:MULTISPECIES: hypothetical protein [unclassified Kaistella]|uniref:hypothetical protein n=1 Tax=unclassified Kaistella TaxID=2762626 RepID=UPI002732F99D|nr:MULTISPECIES: hypothetical protein [unclassified Kaistella]MDP2455141.1 hypothetical protein [Kaistella sp. SH11-4b]MDP2458048.1 hypothetical protein [Kaistella sp. SH40-3]MDP2461015.1 hypothetical protein [Kaistella sp. SH19-2b]
MAKLFVFGIGGTGARVIKSLAMLMASGIDTGYEIVPIILDPDAANSDVNRTKAILDDYVKIRNKGNENGDSSFFKNKIYPLGEIVKSEDKATIGSNFVVNIDGLDNGEKFKSFIDHQSLDIDNKKMIDLLFSEDNLDLSLDVGFKGNPNIGSVVLNSFVNSRTFEAFANIFDKDDRIFIVSSIFGGTGSAGFPLLLKNIREGNVGGNNFEFLKDAIVGAISVQPYFKVEKSEGAEIDSHTFISKTKSALYYYDHFLSRNNSLNATYYIGDDNNGVYEHHVGGTVQKNNAHFVELASALAIVDFAKDQSLETGNAKAINPVYREFGVKTSNGFLNFSTVSDATASIIRKPLAQYFYFDLFINKMLADTINDPYAQTKNGASFDSSFISSSFFSTVKSFNLAFRVWLGEMKDNTVSFAPFNINVQKDSKGNINDFSYSANNEIFTYIDGSTPKKDGLFGIGKKNYELYRAKLNLVADREIKSFIGAEDRFLKVFSLATQELLKEKNLINF